MNEELSIHLLKHKHQELERRYVSHFISDCGFIHVIQKQRLYILILSADASTQQ